MATGIASWPRRPLWREIESFRGRVLHSSQYANPQPFAGSRVLVVGFGNSGAEIALDLADAGVAQPGQHPTAKHVWSFRHHMVDTQRSLPYRVVDTFNAPLLRVAIGNLGKLGLRSAQRGPLAQVIEHRKIPVLDIGTIDRIRGGKIKVHRGVERISGAEVEFDNDERDAFDVIIHPTGYSPDLRSLLPDAADVLDQSGSPRVTGRPISHKGLFFCGQTAVATGQLREIGIEAKRIVKAIG